MTNPPEINQAIVALVNSARALLLEAEHLHGQPLYYDSEGGVVEVDEVLGLSADAAEHNFGGQ